MRRTPRTLGSTDIQRYFPASQPLSLPVFSCLVWSCVSLPYSLSCSWLSSAAPCGNLLAFAQMLHLRRFIPAGHTFLGLTCSLVQAGRPPCALLPTFLLGRASQGCPSSQLAMIPLPVATAPKLPFLEQWLHLVVEVLGNTSGWGAQWYSIRAGCLFWFLVGVVCTLNTCPCEMRSWSCCTTVDNWCNHVKFFTKKCLLKIIRVSKVEQSIKARSCSSVIYAAVWFHFFLEHKKLPCRILWVPC